MFFFFPFSLSCLCSLFAELNGSPVTKKYKRTEKKLVVPLKVNYFVEGMQGLSWLCVIVSCAAQRRFSKCKASFRLRVFPLEELS